MNQADINILILDDVNTVRHQLRELLRSFGFQKMRLVGNVEEAKLAMEEEPFHLILADWHMTPTDGFEFLQYVRSHSDFNKTPFIMVTAESTKEKVMEAIQAGVDDYIVKPLTLAHINKIYHVLLKREVLS